MKPLSGMQSALLRALGSVLSPGGPLASLVVLIFHRVPREHDPLNAYEPDAAEFAAQMDVVGRLFRVLPLSEAVHRLRTRSLPARAACITFDDGYADNCEVAAPILAERGLTATFFIATAYLGNGRMWNDTIIEAMRCAPRELDLATLDLGQYELTDDAVRFRVANQLLDRLKYLEPALREERAQAIAERAGAELPRNIMLSHAQLRRLASLGMEIGAHSVTHPVLTRIAPEIARREILESKEQLEGLLGSPVTTFAYPNGRPGRDYDGTHVEMVRQAGYTAAVSTSRGAAGSSCDPYQVPRLTPWDRTAMRYSLRLLLAAAVRRHEAV